VQFRRVGGKKLSHENTLGTEFGQYGGEEGEKLDGLLGDALVDYVTAYSDS
jgi:hypothetical protein